MLTDTHIIESPANKFVALAIQLQSAKFRRKLGKFVLEGAAYIADIVDPGRVEYLLVAQSRAHLYGDLCARHTHRVVADGLMELVCGTVTTRGIAAVCTIPQYGAEDAARTGGLYVVCEALRDPGNLGTIIRTAAAAGAAAVLALPGCADAYAPKVVRASSGGVLSLPVLTGQCAEQCLRALRGRGVRIYAAHLDALATPYDVDLRGDNVVVIGNEARGVSAELAQQCTGLIKLPMPGAVDSLNASVAAGIVIYEFLRQNRDKYLC